MSTITILLLTLTWIVGVCVRVYRQARFFQIEEYMNLRYLRWWVHKRERVIVNRAVVAAFVGGVLAFFLSEAPDSILPAIIGLIASIIALIPPDEGEIKKPFRRTQRATRLLGTAFVLVAILMFITVLGIINADIDIELAVIALMVSGLVLFTAAPTLLVLANLLMFPVEGYLRGQFVKRAKGVIADIHPKVIGITGSYGKTTTKNFVTDILNGRYRVYATPKSYNTMMGICLAINNDLAGDYSVEYFVVEMGAYIPGEIERIAQLTPPAISIVTEVGPQHLERFGTLENIAIAKYEIIKALPPDGVGIFNYDNPYVRGMYERGYPNTRIAVSKAISLDEVPQGGPRFIATDAAESLDGLRFTVTDMLTNESEEFVTPVIGEHNVTNILLATATAICEGMSLRDVAHRVRQLQPVESRLVRQTTPQGITIINDAYSANPTGVISALKVLGMHISGRRVLITPGMVELGDLHETENQRLGELAAKYATDVILVGTEQSKPVKSGLQASSFPEDRIQVVEELREAVAWYQNNLQPGDTVMFLNDLPDTY